jgi:hypothetical protein
LVEVIPTLILDPDEGPVGTVVTARGYGFPASNSVLYNVTLDWDYVDACTMAGPINLGYVVTDGNGFFITTFDVPATVGGTHTVTAQANQSIDPEGTFTGTSATDTFSVIPTLGITPTTFTNNGSIITVTGSGLDYWAWYNLCLDNKKDFYSANVLIDFGKWAYDDWIDEGITPDDLYLYESAVTSYFQPDCTGDIEFEFVAAGFAAGTHVVTIYKLTASHQLPAIEDFVLFTVTAETPVLDKLDEIEEKLDDIQDAVEEIDFSGIGDDLDEILSELAALGDIQTDLTSVLSNLADIKALAQTAATQATEASTSAGTAASSADAAETAAEAASAGVAGISTAVYGAIILSLIAALASIVAVITLQRKVA